MLDMNNKQILETANAAITQGDYEGFLSFCADDTIWTFVGEQTLHGKEAVRQYMAATYLEPPKFRVENLICGRRFCYGTGQDRLERCRWKCYQLFILRRMAISRW
jgi:ketosteroid isomerase-like protein